MSTVDRSEIASLLASWKGFRECILRDVIWLDFGTTVDLCFDYIHGQDGGLVWAGGGSPTAVRVRLRLVEQLHLRNGLNRAQLMNPENLNWGFSEIALLRLSDEVDGATGVQSEAASFHRLECLWETDRRLDVLFGSMEITTEAS